MRQYNKEAFNPKAEKYEQKWEAYLRHTHEIFLDNIEPKEGETLLDASSGTGLLALELSESDMSFERLVLNDPSSVMLNFARKRLAGYPEITFSNQTAEKLDFGDDQFDGILCLNAFHFYGNQQQVLANFHRLLTPEGKLYILDWNRSGFFRFINPIINWSTSENINTRSLVEMRDILKGCGFQIVDEMEWNWRYWNFFFIEANIQQCTALSSCNR